jgi:hypothetical protein
MQIKEDFCMEKSSNKQKPLKIAPVYTYKAEYKSLMKQAVMLGMSFEDIAERIFNVPREILLQWMVDYPDFAEAAKDGGEKADMLVVDSLHKIATGFEYNEEVVVPGQGVETITRYYEPNVNAIKYWLSNRKSDKWKNKVDNNLSGEVNGGVALVVIDKDDEGL